MSVLVIANEEANIVIPIFEEHITIACIGIADRVGDKYQHLRDRGDVIFTGGLEPVYYFAMQNIHFKLVFDGRDGDVYFDAYKGIDHIPD